MFEIVSVIITLIITYTIGSYIEKNHFKKIQQREIALIKKPIISYGAKKWTTKREIKKIEMVKTESFTNKTNQSYSTSPMTTPNYYLESRIHSH